ncbi:MAG: class I SAM-dependent methyltransferase [Actinomycetota bacterium]
MNVHPSNAEQLGAWDGDEGEYWAAHADRFDRAVATHHGEFLAAAAIGRDDRVLDVGCGTGQTTCDAARAAAAGSVVGIDLSSAMLEYARRRAADEGLTNVSFEQGDAQVHPFDAGAFDIAISRTGAMFFGDPIPAFTHIGRALRPGGRLTLLTWQSLAENEWIREISGALAAGRDLPVPPPEAPSPFALSDPDRVAKILSEAGFVGVQLDGRAAPMWFGHDADDAHRFVVGLLGWMLGDLDDAGRARALDGLRSMLAAHETPDGVLFASATWTVEARRPQ